MNDAENWCDKVLNYQFSDSGLLTRALTHRSASRVNNERLEFLGDAVLDLAISHELFSGLPKIREYGLTRYRAELVRKESLVELAAGIGLAKYLIVSSGEDRSGLRHRDSVLANALEALLGAIFLDGGYESARRVILDLFADRLNNLPDEDELKDPKTRLQEYLQARKMSLPEYELVVVTGAEHARSVEVVCRIAAAGIEKRATDTTRQRAEQKAASLALDEIDSV